MVPTVPSDALIRAVASANIPDGTRILVAVSGGPDSVALLDTLHRYGCEAGMRWQLSAGHVNHGMRPEADGDAQLARQMAMAYGLDFQVRRVDVEEFARAHHRSREDAARRLRYAALRDMKELVEADVIALAHNRDDQVETVLLHLLRGSGLTGLAGMRVRSADLVRPFLTVSRAQILEACQQHNLPYRIDNSNFDRRFARNRLRLDILPFLRERYLHLDEALARASRLVADDADYLRSQTDRVVPLLDVQRGNSSISASLGVWRSLHVSLQRSTLRELSSRLLGGGEDIEAAHVERMRRALLSSADLTSQLPRNLQAYVQVDRFILSTRPPLAATPISPVALAVPGSAEFEGGRIEARILSLDDRSLERAVSVCGPFNAILDPEVLGTELVIRSRRPGDRMQPLGMAGSRKIQDILVDAGVDAPLRDRVPIVETNQHIVWLAGLKIDGRAAISNGATQAIHLRYIPKNSEIPW